MPEQNILLPPAHLSAKRACVERSEPAKRPRQYTPQEDACVERSEPAKRKRQWTPQEDELIVQLRERGEKWVEICKRLHDRSATSCRLRYQNFLERRQEWSEADKNKLAELYERYDIDSFGPTP